MTDCPFCQRVSSGDVTDANAHAVAFADAYPVAAGHTLVVPRRTWRAYSIWRALRRVPGGRCVARPDGRCVAGTAALVGRTARTAPVFAPASPLLAPSGLEGRAAHVYVIPRRAGDVGDPRGGVRRVLPGKAADSRKPIAGSR